MNRTPRIEPNEVVQLVESYVYSELAEATKYDNRTPLDESGVWSLHRLAAQIYAIGHDDGERVECERNRKEWLRERERNKASAVSGLTGLPEASER